MTADLARSLAVFCRTLNRDYGFHIGPRELQDAARAIAVIPLGDEAHVRHALRPVLCRTEPQARVFDVAFRAFFIDAIDTTADVSPDAPRQRWISDASERLPAATRRTAPARDASTDSGAEITVAIAKHRDGDDTTDVTAIRSRRSPRAGTGEPPEVIAADERWREAARAFVRQLESGLGRRWRPARHGPRFDLRRTWRSSLHTAGDVVLPRWRARTRRRPRFVVLIDGSRSMESAAGHALRIAIALSAVTPAVEVFAFSTGLRRITPQVRRGAAGLDAAWPALDDAWGGGTDIGRSLAVFLREDGHRLLSRHSIVLLASDGLDAGDPDTLRTAISDLSQQAAAVVWLNPLLESPGYEPLALGMRTARPYIGLFAWVETPADLAQLGRRVPLRR